MGPTLGISGGGAQLAGELFHRVHALRAFTLLASRQPQLVKDIQTMTDDFHGTAAAMKRNRDAVERFTDPQTLKRASVAMEGLRAQVGLDLAPGLNFAARGLVGGDPRHVGGAMGIISHHQEATRRVIQGSALFLGALGVGRLLGAGRLIPALGRLPGIGRIMGAGGDAFIKEQAVAAATGAGGQRSGQSPQDAIFVIVVGEIFKSGPQGGGGSILPGGKGSVADEAANDVAKASLASRAFGWIRGGLKFNPIKATGLSGLLGNASLAAAWTMAQKGESGDIRWSPTGRPYAHMAHPTALSASMQHWEILHRAQQTFGNNVKGFHDYGVRNINGRAEVYMQLDINQNGQITHKRVHVPLTLWTGGSTPSNQGKQGKSNRSN
jgi:hypothetical protein